MVNKMVVVLNVYATWYLHNDLSSIIFFERNTNDEVALNSKEWIDNSE